MEAEKFKIENLQKVKLSFMIKESGINKGKADYTRTHSATFINDNSVIKDINIDTLCQILESMFSDLMQTEVRNADSIGIWVIYDGIEYENAISLVNINDIKRYGDVDIQPVFEFLLMSIKNN